MKKLMNEIFLSDILKPSLVLITKCCTFCFFILSIFISSSVVFAATIFVPGDYVTIQDAIKASKTGDTVSVAAGTYNENILFPGNKTNITLISENGAASTVIYGDHNGSVVTFAAGINATLDGFTITNGSTSENGGGVLIGSSSSPTITNCIITDNEAFAGGGISCGSSSAPIITNSIIQNNSVTVDNDLSNGGGIHASDSSTPTITNCIIKNNTSNRNGGGLAFDTADATIVNCTFNNNTAAVNGGAISFKNSAPIITNCTFSNNSASGNGGAIACSIPLSGTAVANSILWGDSPDEISCDSEISATYSDIQGETTWPGTGNINADPMFVDEENGDFHLLKNSPCIDAGDNSALALPATDIDGDDRKIDDPAVADTGNGTPPIVDIGAFELNSVVTPIAKNDRFVIPRNVPGTFNILANDTDDGTIDPITVTLRSATSVRGCVLTVNQDGTVTYTPDGSGGPDYFWYTVADDSGTISNEARVRVNRVRSVINP